MREKTLQGCGKKFTVETMIEAWELLNTQIIFRGQKLNEITWGVCVDEAQ